MQLNDADHDTRRGRDRPAALADAFSRDLADAVPRLRRYAWRLSGDRDAADDLVQDTLMRAWRARSSFEPGSNLPAWTRRILRNVFITSVNHRRHLIDIEQVPLERGLIVAERQSHHVDLGDVARLIERLPLEQREALLLVAVDELAYDEAAARIGISLGTLKSRISRGRITLRAMMNGNATAPLATTPRPAARRAGLTIALKAQRRAMLIGA